MCMESKNFSEEDIVNILSLVCADTDKEFVYGLMGSDKNVPEEMIINQHKYYVTIQDTLFKNEIRIA